MKKLLKPRLIIRFVTILLGVVALIILGFLINKKANNLQKIEAATDKNIESVEEEPPSTTEDVTLVFEPIEYDIPLESEQEPETEIEDESTEITEIPETEASTIAETEPVYVEETEPFCADDGKSVYEPEVATPFSETILIDFSEEEWEATYQMVVEQYSEEIQMIAKVIFLEARGIEEYDHKAAIVWTIVNRVDAGFGSTIKAVIVPGQFAYNPNTIIRDDLWAMAADVLTRWTLEKQGHAYVGRVLPSDYLWYWGDGQYNWFRNVYEDGSNPWNWSLPSPYIS